MEYIPIIGLMSGTSIDGIDLSFIFSNGTSVKRTKYNSISKYKKNTLKLLEKVLVEPKKHLDDKNLINSLEHLITLDHISAIENILPKLPLKPKLIGFHGQTIYHDPIQNISIQLGNAQTIVKKFKVDLVYNFRKKDLQNKGQGAPIAPIYHKTIINELNLSLPAIIINIGGISNLTYWDGSSLIGFDTGPGNALMDKYMKEKLNILYDENGTVSSFGTINYKIAKDYCKQVIFTKFFPKSLDKSDVYNLDLWKSINELNKYDAMATLCYVTVETINLNIKLLPKKPKNILICGGGQNNLTLINMLQKKISKNILTVKEMKLNGDYIEAELIAFLAARKLYKLPSTFPSTTGTLMPSILGDLLKFK